MVHVGHVGGGGGCYGASQWWRDNNFVPDGGEKLVVGPGSGGETTILFLTVGKACCRPRQ